MIYIQKQNVLLLALEELCQRYEEFRKIYDIYPFHYFSSLGFSWEAMLKMVNTKLDFISDINMYQFIEKDMGGGVSYMAYSILYGVIKDNN